MKLARINDGTHTEVQVRKVRISTYNRTIEITEGSNGRFVIQVQVKVSRDPVIVIKPDHNTIEI